MESVKICHFKTFRAGNFAFRTFCCFVVHYIHVKKFVCEDISAEYEFESEKFKGVSIDLKLNNLDLSENTTEFKTLPTHPRSHRHIYVLYIRDGICQNLSFQNISDEYFCTGNLVAI